MDQQRVLDDVRRWTLTDENVRLVVLTGSMAREGHAADELSDLDIELYVLDTPRPFLCASGWTRRSLVRSVRAGLVSLGNRWQQRCPPQLGLSTPSVDVRRSPLTSNHSMAGQAQDSIDLLHPDPPSNCSMSRAIAARLLRESKGPTEADNAAAICCPEKPAQHEPSAPTISESIHSRIRRGAVCRGRTVRCPDRRVRPRHTAPLLMREW